MATPDPVAPFRRQFDAARDPYAARSALGIANTTTFGNVNSVGTPISGQLAQWTDATHIQGINISTLNIPAPSSTTPLMDGTATPGVALTYARGDHVHPTDTSRAPLTSPVFTGDPQAPTPATADNDTSIATTAFVKAQGYLIANQTITLSGDVTGSGATAITTTLRNSAALSVIGRSTNSTGAPADISATAASGAVLRESGSTLGFGTIATAGIANDAVDNTKIANMADSTVKGRASGAGTGDPVDLSVAQLIAILGIPTTVRKFTASGTYPTVTNTAVKVLAYCKGAGGGGGGCSISAGEGGGGGEGGESWKVTTAGALSALSVTVGAGGTAVAANTNADGGAGNASSIGTVITANGGNGGQSCNGGGIGGLGGTVGTADWGMPGCCGHNGTNASAVNISPAPGGGKGGGRNTGAGVANSGGGGSGGSSTAFGSGIGGSGIVVCIEFGTI